jgi:outer membrane murein-binding lipoprotein Lpp
MITMINSKADKLMKKFDAAYSPTQAGKKPNKRALAAIRSSLPLRINT